MKNPEQIVSSNPSSAGCSGVLGFDSVLFLFMILGLRREDHEPEAQRDDQGVEGVTIGVSVTVVLTTYFPTGIVVPSKATSLSRVISTASSVCFSMMPMFLAGLHSELTTQGQVTPKEN